MATSSERHLAGEREGCFPNLTRGLYRITSDESIDYNCIAYAAGDATRWWEPDITGIYYWPEGVPREYTLEAFIQAYQSLGYELCADAHNEHGFEKVVIYVDPFGSPYTVASAPTHACRQLESGAWTSKLGPWEDIEHGTLDALSGRAPAYGSPTKYLKRARRNSPGR